MHAPTYTAGDIGFLRIRAEVQHPAYGSTASSGSLRLVVPLTLEVEAVPPNGGLVPELDGRLYFKVKDGDGRPPPPGTAVEVTGAAMAGGKQQLKTDSDGIAVARTKLPAGTATLSEQGAITTVKVRVEGKVSRLATILVPVHLHLDVVPSVDKLVVAPGDSVTVTLSRRRSALGHPLVVELLSATGLVDTLVADGKANKVTLHVPPDRIGVMWVRVRPLMQSGTEEGQGGVDALLVRPARPSFPELHPDRALYDVRSTAKLLLKTHPGAAKSWVAVLVRDLALHQGELPFTSRFLEESFERAVLDPRQWDQRHVPAHRDGGVHQPGRSSGLGARPRRCAGTALAGQSGLEASAAREVLRDPFPLADELRRRGVARVMKAVEASLASALDNGTLNEITVGHGVARRFRPEPLPRWPMFQTTLGDGTLTMAMLEAAVPGFTYHNVARRVARARLVKLLVALTAYLDPGDSATPIRRAAAREPYGRG